MWEIWDDTLYQMQGRPTTILPPNPASEVEWVWYEFGRKLGWEPGRPPRTFLNYKSELDDRTRKSWWRRSGCSWPYCFCARTQPEHPMRVCKGCGLAAYCSVLCQKR